MTLIDAAAPNRAPQQVGRSLISKKSLALEKGVSTRTVDRWCADPSLCFPRPVVIRTRRYWFVDEIVEWDAART
jgi:hypothetical protein